MTPQGSASGQAASAPAPAGRGNVVPLRRPATRTYDAAFDTALEGVLARSRSSAAEAGEAHALSRAIGAARPVHRRLLVLNLPITWWVGLRLADLAEARVHDAPVDAADLAEVAEIAVARLPAGTVPPSQAADFAGRLWRLRALSWIRRREPARAHGALRRARRELCRGSREPLERALLLEARGLLLAAEGRGRWAAKALRTAAAAFRQLGEQHLERRVRGELSRVPAA